MNAADRLFVDVSLVVSTCILGLIYYGVSQRRNRARHVRIMTVAGILDITLVLAIVAVRRALPKAMEADTTILRVHLAFSIPALLLWFTAFHTGRRRLQGRCVRLHRVNAIAFLIARTGNWVTSFFIHPPPED
ncbi:MAG: hypothetical protein ACYTGJ_05055 [Planctomycetota bacterium]